MSITVSPPVMAMEETEFSGMCLWPTVPVVDEKKEEQKHHEFQTRNGKALLRFQYNLLLLS